MLAEQCGDTCKKQGDGHANIRGHAERTGAGQGQALASLCCKLLFDPGPRRAGHGGGNSKPSAVATRAYRLTDQFDRAIADLDQAIQLNPSFADALNNRAAVYADVGDFDRAIEDCDRAIRVDPRHARAFNTRGNAYLGKADYARAIKDYDEAVRLNSRFADAFNNRGVAFLRTGRTEEARRDFDQAFEFNPGHVNALNNRKLLAKDNKTVSNSADTGNSTGPDVLPVSPE